MRSSQAEFRAHVVDCVFFVIAAVFAWSEIAIVRFLISGRRPTLKGYLIAIGCFSICWLMGYFPFRPIWEKFHAKSKLPCASNPDARAEVRSTSIEDPRNQPQVVVEQIASGLSGANAGSA